MLPPALSTESCSIRTWRFPGNRTSTLLVPRVRCLLGLCGWVLVHRKGKASSTLEVGTVRVPLLALWVPTLPSGLTPASFPGDFGIHLSFKLLARIWLCRYEAASCCSTLGPQGKNMAKEDRSRTRTVAFAAARKVCGHKARVSSSPV